ncbi:hypothetical protein ACFC09_15225 [Streptomyces sp. NPDC056161]|uniref:hypothetical protein n=1 Tax=Streptomyces sp. NPDC056161 TaxID=3345732 RepID=UPI0035DBC502
MAANCSHPEPVVAPVVALTELLITHPELMPEASGLAWTLTPTGVIHAEARDAADAGRAVDRCATVMNATPVRASVPEGRGRVVLAELAAVWRGVPVEVWETYTVPEGPRPLGAVVPAGGCRG